MPRSKKPLPPATFDVSLHLTDGKFTLGSPGFSGGTYDPKEVIPMIEHYNRQKYDVRFTSAALTGLMVALGVPLTGTLPR